MLIKLQNLSIFKKRFVGDPNCSSPVRVVTFRIVKDGFPGNEENVSHVVFSRNLHAP